MVKVSGPLMSMAASGTIAKAMTFATWKGRPYVRQRVIPANPKSGGQVGVRAMFKFLAQYWASLLAGEQADWEARAAQKTISPFNAFMSYNQKRWRDFDGCSKLDPATEEGAGAQVSAFTATAGARSITLDITIGPLERENWYFVFFRGLTTGFTPAFDNAIGVIPAEAAGGFDYVDSPLVPDQYFYRYAESTDSGRFTVRGEEVNATVT